MIKPDIPKNESERFDALREYSILDTLPEKEYDDITFLASQICQTPISLVSLIDDKRQWFKSHHGLDAESTPRDVAFCAHAINDKDNIFIVNDSRSDERFHNNPLVTKDPHVIFYAGVPLVNEDGFPLGTLCVIDNKPNELDENQIKSLKALTNQVMKLFELRKNAIVLHNINYELKEQNAALDKFVRIAAHDIKSPLATIIMIADLLYSEYAGNMSEVGRDLLKNINSSGMALNQLIDGILKYSRDTSLISKIRKNVDLKKFIKEVINLVGKHKAKFNLEIDNGLQLFTNKVAFQQIMVNLITNGVKYNDKKQAEITIQAKELKDSVQINVIDNGLGISNEDKERIFNLFETTLNTDNDGFHGTGIGLATVKSLVKSLGGEISVTSELGKGANFEFTLQK